MATAGRRSLPDLSAELVLRPGAFDYVQAARVAEDAAAGRESGATTPVGHDETPSDEAIRYRAALSLAFAAHPIRRASKRANGSIELEVDFLGLTGPTGSLPQHYTELAVHRAQKKDRALAEFLDLLHHRALSLFQRACTKYRRGLSHEQAWRWSRTDPFERVVKSLVGRGLPPTSEVHSVRDRAWLSFAGHYARGPRSAVGLQTLLADFLGLPVSVQQFVGRWMEIPAASRTAMPSRAHPKGLNNSLGRGMVLGQRVWDVGSRIRVEIGPMSRERFLELRPDRELMGRVRSMVADYADGTLEFEVALTLAPGEQLATTLADRGPAEARLGWTARLASRTTDSVAPRVLFSLAAS